MKYKTNPVFRYRWYIFFVLLIAYFFVYFHRMTVGIVGTDIVEDVGGTVGILSSVYFWTYTIMQIPSGLLSDHLGPRKASFIFLTLAAIGSILTALGNEFWMIILGKILIAAGMAVVYIPLMKIISVWYNKSDFPQLNGMVIAVGNVGAIAASAPLELLSDSIGWRNVFMVLALVTMLLAILCILVIRDHPHHINMRGIEETDDQNEHIDATDAKMPIIKGLKLIMLEKRKFWTMAMAYFLVYGSIMVFQGTWAKIYFNNTYDFTTSVAWFITMIGVGKILSTIMIGILNGRGIIKSKRKTMTIGTSLFACVWGVIWLGAGMMNDYWFWLTVCFLFGFFGGFMTLSFTQVKEWYPIAISGTSVSAMNVFLFLGASICTTIAGYIIGTSYTLNNFSIVWAIMFFAAIAALVLVILSSEKKENDEIIGIQQTNIL